MMLEKSLLIILASILKMRISEAVVIVGFGQKAQVFANFLATPLASGIDGDAGWPYVAFDLDPSIVKKSMTTRLSCSLWRWLQSCSFAVSWDQFLKSCHGHVYREKENIEAIQRIHLAFLAIPMYACAQDMMHLLELKKAGATDDMGLSFCKDLVLCLLT